jgi:putative membrane protein
MKSKTNDTVLITFILLFTFYWISTLVGSPNKINWCMENVLVVSFILILIATRKHHPFSKLSYFLILFYLGLHVYGAQYTYSKNPFGFWMKDVLHNARNPYDRFVHFSFGFLLVFPMQELLFKKWKISNWALWIIPIEVTLSLSGLSEIFEWLMTDILFPKHGSSFLAAQGDMWDAQKDMFMATFGAEVAVMIIWLVNRRVMYFDLHKNIKD